MERLKRDLRLFPYALAAAIIIYLLSLIGCSGEDSFVLKPGGGVIDVDGNSYKTVIIGNQEWMAENLKTLHLNDGSEILFAPDLSAWFGASGPAVSFYQNNILIANTYGALYNWDVVKSGKGCPIGWHVPTNKEWEVMVAAFGGDSKAGGKLKESGTNHWQDPNDGATNYSGFNALPGGYIYPSPNSYGNLTANGFWWTATESTETKAISWVLFYNNTNAIQTGDYLKKQGLSIRCVKGK